MQDKKFNTSFYHSLYQNEMFTVFRQWIGRLIRTEEDRGDLYILDSRYWEVKNHKTLEYWISKMSIIQKEYIVHNDKLFTEFEKNQKENLIKIIKEFKDENLNEEIELYLINNIDYVLKHKKVPLLKDNTIELNKKLMKIKKNLEKTLNN